MCVYLCVRGLWPGLSGRIPSVLPLEAGVGALSDSNGSLKAWQRRNSPRCLTMWNSSSNSSSSIGAEAPSSPPPSRPFPPSPVPHNPFSPEHYLWLWEGFLPLMNPVEVEYCRFHDSEGLSSQAPCHPFSFFIIFLPSVSS